MSGKEFSKVFKKLRRQDHFTGRRVNEGWAKRLVKNRIGRKLKKKPFWNWVDRFDPETLESNLEKDRISYEDMYALCVLSGMMHPLWVRGGRKNRSYVKPEVMKEPIFRDHLVLYMLSNYGEVEAMIDRDHVKE